jgi:hypothetical protein
MFSDSTWTWSLPADGSVFLFSNRLLMTNQWILWAILHPILRETPHWQKMKTWWHGSCRIAIPCHTGMYIHVYSVLLCLCHYVQYETGDSTKNNRVYSCVRIENCTPLGAKTSHEQLIGDVIEHLAALWTRMFWFVAETYRNHVHQTHKTCQIMAVAMLRHLRHHLFIWTSIVRW